MRLIGSRGWHSGHSSGARRCGLRTVGSTGAGSGPMVVGASRNARVRQAQPHSGVLAARTGVRWGATLDRANSREHCARRSETGCRAEPCSASLVVGDHKEKDHGVRDRRGPKSPGRSWKRVGISRTRGLTRSRRSLARWQSSVAMIWTEDDEPSSAAGAQQSAVHPQLFEPIPVAKAAATRTAPRE
jgi:hypothetical protein